MQTSNPRQIFRFRDFELDVAAYELRRQGRPVKLGRQPMDLLILLVGSRRQLVSRSDIVERLWGKDVFVDVETGVNTAISKIRQALRDSPDAPEFVETVPGKGYRFIAAVEVVSDPPDHGSLPVAAASSTGVDAGVGVSPASKPRTANQTRLAIALPVVVLVAGVVAWTWLGGGTVSRVTLAVLPFANIGSDPEREYLAAGLTEETSASLAQVDPERLSVKERTLRYKGTTKTVAEIGRELSVDYLVESTIRAEASRLRVTATLIRVRDQEHVWSQSYEREPTSLLGLEQELSTAIADQIRVRLSPDHVRGSARRQTQNPDAFDAYLRGRFLASRRTAATNAGAVQQYLRAIALDSNYALAWSSLGFTYVGSVMNSDAPPLDMGPLARDAAAHAVHANANLAESQLIVGYVNWALDWDWTAAESALRRAIRLDPSDAAAYRTLGHALSQSRQHGEAEQAMRRTRELEPLEPFTYALSAQVAFQARDYRAAVEHARRAVLIDSTFWIGNMQLGQAFEATGESDLALVALTDAVRFSGGNSKAISLRGYILAKTGQTNEAREVLRKLEADAAERYVPPYAMALVHAGLGEREAAFAWLEKAYDVRDVHLIYLTVDPKWDPYRSDARFDKLLVRCGFTPRPGHSPAKPPGG
jgi:TolB-like protein/DNA-binding winged helix-turn-helix (wHTH) protein/Flp pilus assembly protein TadD